MRVGYCRGALSRLAVRWPWDTTAGLGHPGWHPSVVARHMTARLIIGLFDPEGLLNPDRKLARP